jgi:hypothetical protein
MAVPLPTDFLLPEESARGTIIEECILPIAPEWNLPFAMMIGGKRQVNPGLRLAGDAGGRASVGPAEYLCAKYPENKFLCTMRSRENQQIIRDVLVDKYADVMATGWRLQEADIARRGQAVWRQILGVFGLVAPSAVSEHRQGFHNFFPGYPQPDGEKVGESRF